MLCSDGVSDNLSFGAIKSVLKTSYAISTKAKSLIDKAILNGSRDNLSVILIEVKE